MHDVKPSGRDVHYQITKALIAALEAGPGQFVLPWRRVGGLQLPTNALTDKAYNGINVIALWLAAQQRGFTQSIWATYKQWGERGAQVRRDERAALIVFYKEYDTKPDPDVADDTGRRRVARASFVFNAEQVDGFSPPAPSAPLEPIARLARADAFVQATGASIAHGGERAFYIPSVDRIQMPAEQLFIPTQAMSRQETFYATVLHELIHWTGAKHRLDRNLATRFGTEAYAAEELIAEIGAAFLCGELEITPDVRPDHAQYLAEWLKLLRSDNRAVFTAAARASEAARYLHAFSQPAVTDTPPEGQSVRPVDVAAHA